MLLDEPEQDSMLIFNTLSGSLFELEPSYRQSIERLKDGYNLSKKDHQNLTEMTVEGYVVDCEKNENAMVINQLHSSTYAQSPTIQAVVINTMTCNLACKYCFEYDMDKTKNMDTEMALKIFDRILELFQAISANSVEIDYYGGEPLLNIKVIKFLSEKLQTWCAKNNKSYCFSLTTNGTLLTKELVKKMQLWGLKNVRITLDGVKEIHDERRPFRSAKGSSFEIIVKNIRDVINVLPVTLVFVYSEDTVKQLPALLDELKKQGILAKLATIQAGPELPYLNQNGIVCGNSQGLLTKKSAENFSWVIKQFVNAGVSLGGELLKSGNCSVAMAHGLWVFDVDGEIYKCPALIGKPKFSVGHISQIKLNNNYYKSTIKELWMHCLQQTDCPYLPMCGTGAGCRYAALVGSGDLWGNACPREFLDHHIPEMMRMEYTIKYRELS